MSFPVGAILIGPTASYPISKHGGFHVKSEINGGWSWSCQLPETIPINFADLSVFYIQILSPDGVWVTPPLVATPRSTERGAKMADVANLHGIDLTSYYLGRDAAELPTMKYLPKTGPYGLPPSFPSAAQMIQVMADAAYRITTAPYKKGNVADVNNAQVIYTTYIGVDGGLQSDLIPQRLMFHVMQELFSGSHNFTITNPPTFEVPEFDIHGGKWINGIARLLHDTGYSYKIDEYGNIVCFASNWFGGGVVNIEPYRHKVTETYDRSKKITSFKIVKTAKVQTSQTITVKKIGFNPFTLSGPLKNVTFRTLQGSIGFVDLITTFDGDPNTGLISGEYNYFNPNIKLPPLQTGSGIVKSFTCEGFSQTLGGAINVLLQINGMPIDALPGIDWAFDFQYDTGETPDRPLHSPIDGSLMPTYAFAQQMAPAILFDKMKGYHSLLVDIEDPIPWIQPGMMLPMGDYPLSRIEAVEVGYSGEKWHTHLECACTT